MKKSTFIGNLATWVVVAIVSCGFLAWWHLGNGTPNISDPLVQLGVVLAAPLLLYALGVLICLALLWFKGICVRRMTKRVCRAIGILALVLVMLAGVPAIVPETGEALVGPAMVVVYVSMVAPLLIMAFGVVYAVGCAGVDTTKRGSSVTEPSDSSFE